MSFKLNRMRSLLLFFVFNFCFLSSIYSKRTVIEIKTVYGDIYIELYSKTKKHRANFIRLAEGGFFDETLFHRVIKDFMIQGGDPFSRIPEKKDSVGEGGPGYEIDAEFFSEYIHKRGVIAAARNSDDVNPKRKSAGSQFYIVQGRKFTDAELDKFEQRISGNLKRTFKFSLEARKVYKEIGGTPWLDMQYTVFGEVIKGMDVVDKIAYVKTGMRDMPQQEVKMDVNVLKMSRKEYKLLLEKNS